MLVLTRKTGESIVIDGGIEVEVVSVKGNRVRLGVKADKKLPVHRKEIQRAIEGPRFEPHIDSGVACEAV